MTQGATGMAPRGRSTQVGAMTQPIDGLTGKSRAQVLNLIDFLSAYDAQRNPPVRKIEDHGMFRVAGNNLPDHPAVRVRPSEQVWLAVDFIDLPPVPAPPEEVGAVLVDAAAITAQAEPQLIPPPVADPRPNAADGVQQEVIEEQAREAEQAQARMDGPHPACACVDRHCLAPMVIGMEDRATRSSSCTAICSSSANGW